MAIYSAIIGKDKETGLFVGRVPTLDGAYSQGETLEELHKNLYEILNFILGDGESENCKIISYVIIDND